MEVRVTTMEGNVITGVVNKISRTLVSLENATVEQVTEMGDFEVFRLYGNNYYATIFKENVKKIDII